MKKLIQLISFAAIALAFTAISTEAQSYGKKFDADVSFDFAIGDKVLPAGKYVLRVAGDPNGPNVLEVRNAEWEIVYRGVILINGKRSNGSAQLHFEDSSGRPVLSSIVSKSEAFSLHAPSRSTLMASKKNDTRESKN
jgi:hypothetical protein